MSESKPDTVGDALPREIARVRDEVIPAYMAIGAPGMFVLPMIRAALDKASRAMIEGDVVAAVRSLIELRGIE